MDLSSKHALYIFGAFGLSACLLTLLTLWILQADRKIRKKLQKKDSVEIIFHHSLDYEKKSSSKKTVQQNLLKASEQRRKQRESLKDHSGAS